MFERFTDQARRVVVLAQDQARSLGHDHIGTEHILLSLLSESEGLAAQALAALEISLDAARDQVVEIVEKGAGQPSGHIPFTPRTKKVLELSLREAQRLGDDHIGTEHILLGLVRESEGVGAQILVRLGANLDRVTEQVLATVKASPAEELRRVSVGRMPVERIAGLREVMSRLDEITDRLTAIENLLAEIRNPASTARKASSGEPELPGGAQREPPAGGGEPPGQPEPPAAEA